MSRRPAIRTVLLGGVLASLVAVTGGVVIAGERTESVTAAFGVQPSAESAETGEGTADSGEAAEPNTESSDVPLLNESLDESDLVHLTPASRSQLRAALVDGEGTTFTAVVDGEALEITTVADTLSEALVEAGVVLGWDDVVSADLSAAPEAGAEVLIGRASTEFVTEQVVTEFETEERNTSDLLVGETRVVQEGVDGDARVTSEVQYVDGVEVSRSTVVNTVLTEAVTEIIEVGTGKPTTSSGGSSSSGGTVASTPVEPGSNRALGKQLMLEYGFAEDQWGCLEALWTKESQWNHQARNTSSGAFGIPQALPGSKMASAGSDWATNPATQIKWGLGYISGRYSTPCGAWSAFKSKGWY